MKLEFDTDEMYMMMPDCYPIVYEDMDAYC